MTFRVYAVNSGTVEDVREYAGQFDLPIEWAETAHAEAYGASDVPATVVLRNGHVDAVYFSQREPEVWREILRRN